MPSSLPRPSLRLIATAALLLMAGCSAFSSVNTTPTTDSSLDSLERRQGSGSMLGDGGLSFGGNKGGQDNNGIGVNAFLWRGALDALSFMPLSSADPFGGVIITDWYQPPAASGERFKATAYILGRELRADGLKVSIYRQVQQGGQWVDAALNPSTATEIENRILARARELRADFAAGK
jgi:hypothetical protein